jgi:hypothetical protein
MNTHILTISALAAALSINSAAAQEALPGESTPIKEVRSSRQDLSLFSQHGGPVSATGSSIQGLLYRRALSRHPQGWWKAGIGTGTFSNYRFAKTDTLAPDLAADISYETREQIYLLLFGAEAERKLWRGIFLTAGLETQIGSTRGGVDSVSYQYGIPPPGGVRSDPGMYSSSRFASTRSYFGSGLLLLGLRGYVKRFTIAGEGFVWVRAGTVQQKISNNTFPSYSLLDAALGRSGVRFSVGYCF